MPHAQSHDDLPNNDPAKSNTPTTSGEAGKANDTTEGSADRVDALADQARHAAHAAGEAIGSFAGTAGDAVKSAADTASQKASSAATATGEAAKTAAGKVNALPTYAKVLGAAALVGGIAAAAVLPFLNEPEDTGRAKRKKAKGQKKA
ncbi:hypothetical protein SAMN05192583_2231 [Sphingomonas gellani]|uniref:Uncharacterized protein n=2 Tax=Sphingomonas gellani TaxID=1166340 RepID=A0A1H8EMB9_9SPHN|nr:hypothetical protein SAMN05192583_2231 [Sphingomonas gellani]